MFRKQLKVFTCHCSPIRIIQLPDEFICSQYILVSWIRPGFYCACEHRQSNTCYNSCKHKQQIQQALCKWHLPHNPTLTVIHFFTDCSLHLITRGCTHSSSASSWLRNTCQPWCLTSAKQSCVLVVQITSTRWQFTRVNSAYIYIDA